MADTRQIVSWALERACPMRSGENWHEPDITCGRLSSLRSCAEAMARGDIVEGIWVTGNYWGSDASGNNVYIPCSGIRVASLAEGFGGWDQVRSTCGPCEANVALQSPGAMAGCHGSMDVMYPHDEDLEALLWETIRLHGLEERLKASFHVTQPLWFGLWIGSPLRRAHCELLLELLPRCLPRLWGRDENGMPVEPVFDVNQFVSPDFDPSEYYGREFQAFFDALRAATEWELPLHVRMAPPGHTDCGFYTEFPHCPRCKAAARVARWTESVASQQYWCEVCGHTFDPSKTYRSEPYDFNDEETSLERQLGADYDAFVLRYGQSKGHTEQQMTEALDIHRDGPRKRRVAECRKRVKELERESPGELLTGGWDRLSKALILEVAPGIPLELLLVPPGEFVMGSSERDEEQPPHTVRFEKPFYIGKYPVTQVQWAAVMGVNHSRCKGQPMLPVEQVNWFDAQDFCASLSRIAGRHVRLPSEAEWEYACRAGTTTRFWFGDQITPERVNCDFSAGTREDFLMGTLPDLRRESRTTPVDRYPSNPWGLYDMHGNVEEWCQDSWHPTYEGAPADGRAWIDREEPVDHVARGGAAYTIGAACRSSARRQQRANCGAREINEEASDDESLDFLSGLLDIIEFYGLRVVCSPVKTDVS